MPQTVILAGGLGSRLSEETYNKPKPMVEIGKIPIISHIMNIYIKHNYNNTHITITTIPTPLLLPLPLQDIVHIGHPKYYCVSNN